MLLENKAQSGLQHIPSGGALALHSVRSSIFARGRRDAANSSSNSDYQRGVAEYNAGRFPEAAASFSQAAEQGHAESQYILSTMYDAGKGVPQDDAQAARWEHRSADQGHLYAEANLSFRCYSASDLAGAFEWCQRAADGELAWAQYNLALMYQKGEGVARSEAEAAHWYRLAASQGFADAQLRLADLYYTGQGIHVPQLCRRTLPACGLRVVLRHALACVIHGAEDVLRFSVTLVGGLAEARSRLCESAGVVCGHGALVVSV